MEAITVKLNDGAAYDEIVRGKESLAEAGDLMFVTKDHGTVAGKAVVAITFHSQMPDGSVRRVQAATTFNALHMALSVLEGRYGTNGRLAGAN